MKLNKALKEKKKLVQKVNQAYTRFSQFNSFTDNQKVDYAPETQFELYLQYTSELIDLKTKIQKANVPILDKIYRISELKSLVNRLNGLRIQNGEQTDYRSGSVVIIRYNCWMNTVDRDNRISLLEAEIEKLQEEIDAFNATTDI